MAVVRTKQTTVDYTKAVKLFKRLQTETGRSSADILKQGGRVGAMVMADRTFPRGFGNNFREKTKKNIIGQLSMIFASRKKMFELMEQRAGRGVAAKFAALMEDEKFAQARKMAEKFLGITIQKKVNPVIHRQSMKTRRPVVPPRFDRNPVVGVWEFDKVLKYAKDVAKTVGRAKAGWLTIARSLGGTRKLRGQSGGISGSLKRDGEGTAVVTQSLRNPFILLTNRVPYIDQMTAESSKAYANREAFDRMVKFARSTLAALARKARVEVPA